MAQTLNGFIAKNDDSTPWCDEGWDAYSSEIAKHDCLIIGKRTFDIMDKEGSLDDIGNPFTIIVSKEVLSLREGFAVAHSPEQAIEILKQKGFESAIIGGGASTNTAFLSLGLVDEIIIDVESQLFSTGIPFINPDLLTGDIKLKLSSVTKISDNLAQLRYSFQG